MSLRMRLRAVVMSVLFVVAFAASGSGATYYVATAAAGGSDSNPGSAAQPWATIQKAVDTIANGDTIIVKNGTYVGARISNSGSSVSPKTLQAENNWGAKINVPEPTRNRRNGNLELGIFAGDGPPVSYWVIDGFEVDGQLLHRCIDIVGQDGSAPANHITVKNCHVHHAKNGANISTGIFDGYHSYALYENNVTHNNTEHGMYHSNSSDYAVIRSNVSYSNTNCGFHNNGDLVGAGAPGRIRYVLYEKNIAYDNGLGAAINCGGEHFSVYRNNLLYGNRGNGFTFYGKGESDTSSHDNRIYNNTVVMPSNGRYAALLADSANNNWFYNNILHNSNSAGKGSFTIDKPNITGFQSDYNVVMPTGFNIDGDVSIGGTDLATWRGFGWDTHSITATLAELFVDPGANDYRLKAGSPAIDAGTDLSTAGGSPVNASVTDDIEGRARPVGAAFDIGCYEYTNQPTVETPVFSPPAGSYSPSVDVTITCATALAEIRYTTNGTDPTASSTLYSAPVSITTTATLKARAFKAAMDASAIASGVYTISLPQTEITIQEGTAGYNSWEDTWIDEDSATTAHYADEIFHLQAPTQDRQLHRFSLSPVPAGVQITSATLYIYQMSSGTVPGVSGSPTISAYRILTHWIENQATYNKRTSANNWGTPGMLAGTDYDATPVSTTGVIATGTTGWVGIDVTSLVNGWYIGSYTNEGVMIKCSANGHLRTYSTKHDPVDQRPKLVLSYQLPTPKVETPAFNPVPGTYGSAVDVTISCATAGADIRYTTDGNDPTQASTQYTAPIHIASATTLKARAFKAAMDPSDIRSGDYSVGTELVLQQDLNGYTGWEDTWLNGDTDPPGTQPNTNYSADEIFHLQYNTPDRQLHRFDISGIPAGMEIKSAKLHIYQRFLPQGTPTVSAYRVIKHWIESQATFNKATTSPNVPWGTPGMQAGVDYDGAALGTSDPVTTLDWFSVDITAAVDAWYKGTAVNEGVMIRLATPTKIDSYSSKTDLATLRPKAVIVYGPVATPKVATPTFDPAPGTYVGSVDVSLSCATAGAEIRYTLDGSDPTDTSALYSAPIHITTTKEIKARGFKAGMDPSDVASGVYEISGTIAAPTFSPPAGTYNSAQDVTISCATFGATIHYTTNGATPNGASPVYSSPIHVATTTTIKAIATKSGAPDSSVSTALYKIDAQAPAVSGVATVPTAVKAGIDLTITLTASATDASTGNSSITAAECFVGADPGTGHGTAMNAADGAFDSPTEALIVSLDCSSWAPPTSVRLNVRARDAAGNWSIVQFLLVPVVSAIPPGAVRDLTISPDAAYLKAPLTVVSFSSQAPALPVTNLVDSDARTCWQSAGTATREEEYVTVDLGSVERIAAVAVCVGNTVALFPTEFTIAVSSDLSSWDEVATAKSFKATGSKRFVWQFEPVDARYVKISGPGNYNRREGEYAWQLGEIEVPMSLATSWAVLQWTAPADDGYAGPSAAEYDVRCSQVPILAANFAAAASVPGIGAPSIPGTKESFNADMGDLVGNIFVALKTVDSMDNWSALSNVATGRIGGARILGTYPDDGTELDANFKPVFFFAAGGSIKSLAAVISSSPDFPFAPIPRPSGERDTTVRFGLSAKSNSWKVSPGQWKKIKETSLSDGVLHWRIEGKAVIDKLPTVLFSPTRSVYFDVGSIDSLHVDPSHAAGADEAVWPTAEIAPAFSWTNNSPISQYFFIDVSTLPNVPLSDKRSTFTLGGKGIVLTTYQMTAADWKKLRKLAGSTDDGALYWRMRGTDADKALSAASSPKKLVVDSGEWTLTSLPSLSTVPPEITWTHVGDGVVAYSLQFSVEDDFPASARYSLKVPAKSLTAMTYTLSPAEITRLAKLAARNGVTLLYYRVRGEDAQKAFIGYSPAQTTSAP